MSGPDIEGLRRFSEETSRHLTEFFVGREDLIGFVERRCQAVHERSRAGVESPARGVTVLFQGAPGMSL